MQALIFSSTADKVADFDYTFRVKDMWEKNGSEVTLKVFDNSDHVRHYQKNREEYEKLLNEHLRKIGILET